MSFIFLSHLIGRNSQSEQTLLIFGCIYIHTYTLAGVHTDMHILKYSEHL